MVKLKKIIGIICALAMSMSFGVLAACGGGGDSASSGGTQDSTQSDTQGGGNSSGTSAETPAGAKDYILEAENIDLSYVVGGDTSANPSGASLITANDKMSGGKFIRALYVNELFFEFEFVCDKAVDDAVITFSFAGEIKDFDLFDDEFQIYVNPELDEDTYEPIDRETRIEYGSVSLTADYTPREYKIAEGVSLKEGKNIIYCQVYNTESLAPSYSTMNAKAPMIDYLKINTTATVVHTTYENE